MCTHNICLEEKYISLLIIVLSRAIAKKYIFYMDLFM